MSNSTSYNKPLLARKLTALFILGLIFFYLLYRTLSTTVHSGEKGVLWKRFDAGTEDRVYDEGRHLISPFNIMYTYDTRVQQREVSVFALTNNGESVSITAILRLNPIKDKVHLLHQKIGPDYIERVVIPETQAVIREVIGEYALREVHAAPESLAQTMALSVASALHQSHIQLDTLRIKDIQPTALTAEDVKADGMGDLPK